MRGARPPAPHAEPRELGEIVTSPLSSDRMRCERRALLLTKAGCARLYESVVENRPYIWEGRHACLNCPTGARTSGRVADATGEAVETWRYCCARCFKGGSRLIGGLVCVSCWNRAREARIGCDRKGNRPRFTDNYHEVRLNVVRNGSSQAVCTSHVVSAAEVMVSLAKGTTTPLSFGWSPAGAG